LIRGTGAIFATYVFFLLFAQFGFIRILNQHHELPNLVPTAMLVMGLSGLAASLGTGWLLGRVSAKRLLQWGFAACAAAAGLAPAVSGLAALLAVSSAIGMGAGMLTVTLAASLAGMVPGRTVGRVVGWGTGLAYGFCNIPVLFEAGPAIQAGVCAILCIGGWLLMAVPARENGGGGNDAQMGPARIHLGFAGVLAALLALVWLDSAAFNIIQDTLSLKNQTWGTPHQKEIMGATHLAAAVLAGVWLDRGHLWSLLLAAFGLFAAAFTELNAAGGVGPEAGMLYATGISFYSTALVFYPSSGGGPPGGLPARWRAALLFAVAGWIGSAMGVGMAQQLHRIPGPFMAAAGVLILGAFLVSHLGGAACFARRFGRLAAVGLAAIAGFGLHTITTPVKPLEAHPTEGVADDSVARGRRVYIREGCIHCHSQFIRPRTADVQRWGPPRPVDPAEHPPLIGNRRQGPDLLNVGLRRSRDWLRLHQIEPAAVSPGSSMPSYRHLFSESAGGAGDDLVAYLASLGADRREQYERVIAEWTVSDAPRPDAMARGRAEFQQSCVVCHGEEGRGDGPASAHLSRPARDLTSPDYIYAPRALPPAARRKALARIVKFGIPGTSMPGHEYLNARQVSDLVSYLEQLTGGPEQNTAIGASAGT
jgi:cbb3-type cytochrome oxidase cytochrome c subunit